MCHAKTDHTQKNKDHQNLLDCSRQRNLSAEGVAQAKRTEQMLRLDRTPGEVFSRAYYRCRDTPKRVSGQYKVKPELTFSISKDAGESRLAGRLFYDMMINAKGLQGNTVFAGHTSNLCDGLDDWPKPEDVLAVSGFNKTGATCFSRRDQASGLANSADGGTVIYSQVNAM